MRAVFEMEVLDLVATVIDRRVAVLPPQGEGVVGAGNTQHERIMIIGDAQDLDILWRDSRAEHNLVALVTCKDVGFVVPDDVLAVADAEHVGVITVSAHQQIVARAAGEDIVALETFQDVVTVGAGEQDVLNVPDRHRRIGETLEMVFLDPVELVLSDAEDDVEIFLDREAGAVAQRDDQIMAVERA